MAKTLRTTVKLSINGLYQDPQDLSTPEDNLNWTKTIVMATGTGTSQADRLFHDKRTLNAAASETLDFAAGGLVDAFGAAFSPAKIKFLAIYVNTATSGAYLTVGGNASNQLATMFGDVTDKVEVGADSPLIIANTVDGFAVTAGTGDILKIENPSGVAIEYEIVVVGTSA